jgi:hypothetical protein
MAPVPIGGRRPVQMRQDMALEGGDIGRRIGIAKKPVEGVVIRQVPGGGELQAVERDMRGIDVDRRDMGGPAVR